MPEKKEDISKIHKYFAVNLFNETWTLLDKEERTEEEDLLMIHKTHASLYHWLQIGGPKEFSIGEWQIARVYAVLGMYESALRHGFRNEQICLDNDLKGFELAYAYESIARAYAIKNNTEKVDEFKNKAMEQAELISSKDDKKYLIDDLKTI